MPIYIREPASEGVRVEYELAEIIYRTTTPFQELIIADTPAYGRSLFLDGLIQSSECDEVVYHESLVHPALFAHGSVKRVLVGGTGEGASIRELVRHRSVESVVTVDLDREVVEACQKYLPSFAEGSLADPRVESRFEDIQVTLETSQAGEFDAVILDLTDPVEEGPASGLFTGEFYRRVKRVMADDAVLVVQAGELDPIDLATPRALRNTLQKVFAWTHVLQFAVPCFHAMWSLCLASDRPLAIDPQTLDARIAQLCGGPLRFYSAAQHGSVWTLPHYLVNVLERPDGDARPNIRDDVYVYPRS